MKFKLNSPAYTGLLLLVSLLVFTSADSFAQRKIGINFGYNGLNTRNYQVSSSSPAPSGFEFGLNIGKWTSDDHFITTNISFYQYSSSSISIRVPSFGGGEALANVNTQYRSTRLDFIFSRISFPQEMDDDNLIYRNLGIGIEFMDHSETVNYIQQNFTEVVPIEGIDRQVFPTAIYGFGYQKNLANNLMLNIEINGLLSSTFNLGIQPRFALFYRLY